MVDQMPVFKSLPSSTNFSFEDAVDQGVCLGFGDNKKKGKSFRGVEVLQDSEEN